MISYTHAFRTALLTSTVAALALAVPANAQTYKRLKLETPAQQTKVIIPQPLPSAEKPTDATVITKNGRSITLGEIRAQQKLFKPPAAALAKPFTLGSKTVRTPVLMQAPSLDNGFSVGRTVASSVLKKGNAAVVALYNCDEKPPVIGRVIGAVTPGSVITLKGACFGTASGQVRMLGSIPGGFRDLIPIKWAEGEIAVQVPADVSGVPDGQMSIEATTPQRKTTNTKPVNFTAKREIVDVSHLWRSGCRGWTATVGADRSELTCGNNWLNARASMFTGLRVGEGLPPLPAPGEYNIEVHHACVLQSSWAEVRQGTISAIIGWYDGPPEKSTITLAAKYHTHLDVHWYGDTEFSNLNYTLRANASCPVGVSPNP